MKPYYAHKEPEGSYAEGCYTIRQERYRERLKQGDEHPHDVMVVARNAEEIKIMADKYLGGDAMVDYSEVGNP